MPDHPSLVLLSAGQFNDQADRCYLCGKPAKYLDAGKDRYVCAAHAPQAP